MSRTGKALKAMIVAYSHNMGKIVGDYKAGLIVDSAMALKAGDEAVTLQRKLAAWHRQEQVELLRELRKHATDGAVSVAVIDELLKRLKTDTTEPTQ